jgi:hypothetical protein
VVALALVRGWTVGVGGAALVLRPQLQGTAVLALQLGTEHLALGRRLERHFGQFSGKFLILIAKSLP